jgi:hypothetical protein
MDSNGHVPREADDVCELATVGESAHELAECDDEQSGGIFPTRGAFTNAVKRCQYVYRAALDWVGINSEGDIYQYLERVAGELDSGEFFLARIGRIAHTDPSLTIALLVMRMRWIEEFHAVGMAEKILIDQALIALYHQLRLTELIGNAEARAEYQFFGDKPLKYEELDRRGGHQYKVDEYLDRLREAQMPALDRCQRMVIRSLRELRRYRDPRLTIQHAEQVNVARQQLVTTVPAMPEATGPQQVVDL